MSFAKSLFFLAFMLVSGVVSASDSPRASDIECRQIGNAFHPWSKLYGREIGHPNRGGFPNRDACQWSVNVAVKANQGIMCAWNEVGYAAFDITKNSVVGQYDIAWRFLRDCIDTIEKHANGMICSYDGNKWISYDIKTNAPQCDTRWGFRSFEDCLDSIRWIPQPHPQPQPTPAPNPNPQPNPRPHPRMSCEWNNYSWQPYNSGVGFIGLARYGFAYVQDCERSVSLSCRSSVCNWDGVGFRAYDVWNNATLSKYSYGSLESCYASVP